jgi:chromosome segregation ATPase
MPLDEIISNINSLQYRLDSLNAVRTQMRQDSATAVADLVQRQSVQLKKAADLDDAIAKKKSMMAGVRSRYEKNQQDSAAIVAKSREQIANVHREIARLDATIAAMTAELSTLSGRREQVAVPAGADEHAINQLQSQVARYDSTIRALRSDFANFSTRRNKLRQDSLQADARISSERSRYHLQMYPFDSLSTLCDIAVRQAEQKQASDQAAKEQKIGQIKGNYSLITGQKKGFEERIARNNADINTLSAERQRLAQSAGAAQTRYEQLRGPYDKALTDAINDLQRLTRDRPLLKTLRQKLSVDSAIAKTRDALDKAIQLAAENKRGGKKLVEQRENELDSLQALQNQIVSSTPGLRQKEAQIHGATISQKAALTDDAITAIEKKTAGATAQLDKARHELEAFDRKNPPVQNPSGQRIVQLDTMLAIKKKEVIQMTDWSDSLNMVLQEIQNTITSLTASAHTGSPKIDSLIKAKKDEKVALAGRRAKVQRDSIQNDAAAMEVINRIRNDCASMAGQLVRTQGDIDRSTAERDKTMQSLAAAQEKNRQANAAALAEKKKNDNLVAAKQQDITNLSLQSEKLRQDSVSFVRQQEQQVKTLSPALGSLAGMLSDYGRDINVLQAQSDTLKRLAGTGQGRINDEAHRVSLQINSVSRSIEDAQNSIAELTTQKKEAFTRLEGDKRYYDSLIGIAEHERDGMIAQRDRVRQDSIAAENDMQKSLQKVMSAIKEQDNVIAAKQKEVADASADLNRSRDDSGKVAESIALVATPGGQSVGSIDSLISVRTKEITGLQDRRDKAVQDSIQESKRLSDLLAAAHNEIVKRSVAVDQRNNELSLSAAVKNEPAGVDPLQRSYKDALTTATTEIQTQNEIIRKKKSDMTRLRAVRDALTSATDTQNTDPSSRLDTDKRYYDSLLSIAGQELTAIIARRDIARQDSASADNNLRASLQKAAPAPAERDNSAGLQKELADATAELNRARDDSIKIANAIPNTLQPYGQAIRTIDVLMGVKAKDLTGLQDQRQKAGQDGLKENKRNGELLAAAHAEIVKRSIALEQKRNELALATAAKNSMQNSTDPGQRNYKQALDAAVLELHAQNELIDNKKNEISRLQNVRDAITAKIKARDKSAGAPGAAVRPATSPRDSAQKCSEDIYVLVGENRIAEASARFAQLQPFLRANLDQETFQALKMTISEMGGAAK